MTSLDQHPACRAALERLYQHHPRRYARLIVWVRQMFRYGADPRHVALTLEIGLELEHRGNAPETWWPYYTQICRRIRSEDVHEQYKHGDLNSVRAVLGKLMAAAEARDSAA